MELHVLKGSLLRPIHHTGPFFIQRTRDALDGTDRFVEEHHLLSNFIFPGLNAISIRLGMIFTLNLNTALSNFVIHTFGSNGIDLTNKDMSEHRGDYRILSSDLRENVALQLGGCPERYHNHQQFGGYNKTITFSPLEDLHFMIDQVEFARSCASAPKLHDLFLLGPFDILMQLLLRYNNVGLCCLCFQLWPYVH